MMSFHLPACQSWRTRIAVALPLLFTAGVSLASSPSSAGRACAGSLAVAYELTIESGVVRGGVESRSVVRVHDDGCVAIERPWFLRDAGTFELRLDAAEREALRRRVGVDALRDVAQDSLQAQTQAPRIDGASVDAKHAGVVFHNTDPDTYTLQWRDGGQTRRLVASDVLDAADHAPKTVALNRVADAIRALQALGARQGKRIAAGSAP